MTETVFSKIIKGEIPCYKIYEDKWVLAFLDRFPVSEGHTLVIPKEAAETLDQLSEESATHLGKVLPKICRAVKQATGVHAYNVLQNNGVGAHQSVFHVHFHVIPKPNASSGLGILWPARSLDSEKAIQLSEKISKAI
jgi:histidine triad (HIT) family protein